MNSTDIEWARAAWRKLLWRVARSIEADASELARRLRLV
jgi:hypothetical protein